MRRTIAGHFDGRVIVPETPVKLPVGKRLRIQVELADADSKKKNGKPRRLIGSGQFRSGVPDLGSNKKHLEGFGKS
jgi:hypothetical protein